MPNARFCVASVFLSFVSCGGLVAHAGQAGEPATQPRAALPSLPRMSADHRERASAMIDRAIEFLRSQQDQATGGWGVPPDGKGPTFPAITGLVLSGMRMNERVSQDDSCVQAGVKFLLDRQQPDGGIYVGMLPSYNTAIALSALARIESPAQVADARARATAYLKSIQYGEGAIEREDAAESAKQVTSEHPFYGGWGYGNRGRPDLSNSAFVLEALDAAGVSDDDPALVRALAFLARCQMLERTPTGQPVNTMPYAAGSTQGGFIYATAINKDTVGQGQSFAGEIHESLSGPPGSEATFSLRSDEEHKPRTLLASEVRSRILDACAKEIDLAMGAVKPECVVALGPNGDGLRSSSFTVRSSLARGRLETILTRAFASELDASTLRLSDVPAWQGLTRLRAYGSMTYAGLKSMVYAGLAKDDERVLAARAWMDEHYTLEENPGMGSDGLYYYYLMFARANDAFGEPLLGDRLWAQDLVERLEELQNSDGSFRIVDDRWMEDSPVLITAYSLVALQSAVGR